MKTLHHTTILVLDTYLKDSNKTYSRDKCISMSVAPLSQLLERKSGYLPISHKEIGNHEGQEK